jgi:hypothetical protein
MFAAFPYEPGCDAYMYILDQPPNGSTGGFMLNPEAVRALPSQRRGPLRGKAWSVRFAGEYAGDRDGVTWTTLSTRLSTSARFGVQASWSLLSEDLGGGNRDTLGLGDVNLTFRLFQHERFQARIGVGLNYLTDEFGSESGINFTGGVDYFPAQPWVLSADVEGGTLGDAEVFHTRCSAGYLWERTEIYCGYDYRRIDDITIRGPLAGLRVWF